MQYFAEASSCVTVFMEGGSTKEVFLGIGFDLLVLPRGAPMLNGSRVSVAFLHNVLENLGVNPQLERIGDFKSAGDQLSRTEVNASQCEMLALPVREIDAAWTNSATEMRAASPGGGASRLRARAASHGGVRGVRPPYRPQVPLGRQGDAPHPVAAPQRGREGGRRP